jgi:nitrate reductase assembly molybdenum cofactor insertion protein NarJ
MATQYLWRTLSPLLLTYTTCKADGNDTELGSFLPATLEFLGLQNQPHRLPLPLFLRQEYSLISQLLEERPKTFPSLYR